MADALRCEMFHSSVTEEIIGSSVDKNQLNPIRKIRFIDCRLVWALVDEEEKKKMSGRKLKMISIFSFFLDKLHR